MDLDYDHYKSNLLCHLDSLTGILKSIIGKIKILEKYLTKVESSQNCNNP